MDLLEVSPQLVNASVHATMFHSLLRKVSHIVSIKSGHYSQLTQSHLCLKSIRQCFTSRHSG